MNNRTTNKFPIFFFFVVFIHSKIYFCRNSLEYLIKGWNPVISILCIKNSINCCVQITFFLIFKSLKYWKMIGQICELFFERYKPTQLYYLRYNNLIRCVKQNIAFVKVWEKMCQTFFKTILREWYNENLLIFKN